ncbi:hypothetical protein B0H12DRAFT_1113300 [Mycena haematopus]|nr:hypothetical protein B0H12DRAFT_1113300 [Mycena haematopus]
MPAPVFCDKSRARSRGVHKWLGDRQRNRQSPCRSGGILRRRRPEEQGYKVGKFWNNVPNFQHFGECPTCNNTWETMEHILTECAEPGQKEIWDLASDMWRLKTVYRQRAATHDRPNNGHRRNESLYGEYETREEYKTKGLRHWK